MREIQAKSTENERYLQSCIENEYHQSIKIESTIDTKIQDILIVDRFGSINVKKGPPPYTDLQRRNDRQAQVRAYKAINSINDVNNVKLKLIRKFNTPRKLSYGCCVTKAGENLFTNYEK